MKTHEPRETQGVPGQPDPDEPGMARGALPRNRLGMQC